MKFHLFVRKIILKENGEKKSIMRTMLVLILKYASPANYSSPKNMFGEFTIPCNIMYWRACLYVNTKFDFISEVHDTDVHNKASTVARNT